MLAKFDDSRELVLDRTCVFLELAARAECLLSLLRYGWTLPVMGRLDGRLAPEAGVDLAWEEVRETPFEAVTLKVGLITFCVCCVGELPIAAGCNVTCVNTLPTALCRITLTYTRTLKWAGLVFAKTFFHFGKRIPFDLSHC